MEWLFLDQQKFFWAWISSGLLQDLIFEISWLFLPNWINFPAARPPSSEKRENSSISRRGVSITTKGQYLINLGQNRNFYLLCSHFRWLFPDFPDRLFFLLTFPDFPDLMTSLVILLACDFFQSLILDCQSKIKYDYCPQDKFQNCTLIFGWKSVLTDSRSRKTELDGIDSIEDRFSTESIWVRKWTCIYPRERDCHRALIRAAAPRYDKGVVGVRRETWVERRAATQCARRAWAILVHSLE